MTTTKIAALVLAVLAGVRIPASAQSGAGHGPSASKTASSAKVEVVPPEKPVARVNGAVLTDRDLLREMFAIFPYARQHNGGFPKAMEEDIRKGALQMIIFEELVYQEAKQRGMTVTPAQLSHALGEFRKQFKSPDDYTGFMTWECQGSEQVLQRKIRRSLLIDRLLTIEVKNKSAVSLDETKAYYEKNAATFRLPETFSFQTISILPPENATFAQRIDARKRAENALKQAKATRNYEEFGLLAEKTSEDDYRVMMGEHKFVERSKLPPQVVSAALALQPGQVSDLIQVEQAFAIVRLISHNPAGMQKFETVRDSLQKQLEQLKIDQLRSALDRKLRAKAKVEVL
ncbi:MAG TPA: peptidylprolyl isomerase [Candidatus Sulfotelmatobacter sp.]|nr:peptidylprolyl isomerase [Candidatus Sulfotelmatobacter sp.]